MIKALFLVFDPAASWETIVSRKRSWQLILAGYLFPLWLMAFAAEFYGLVHWGKPRGFLGQLTPLPNSEALIFEILQLILMLVLVFFGARMILALGETFHGRNTFAQAFTVTAYGLAPVFAIRILDIFPGVSGWLYWVTWGVGILLTTSILYHGIPKVMLPDPSHAFGMYLTSSVLLAMVGGLIRFITFTFLQGKLGKLETLIQNITAHLPFLQSFDRIHF